MTTSQIADYLENGYWDDVSDPLFTIASPHHWSTAKSTISYDANALGSNAEALVDQAFDRWGDIMDMDFQSVRGTADIELQNGNLPNGGGVATASYPGNQPLVASSNPQVIESAEITLDNNLIGPNTSDTSRAFTTVIHEIGHALGLGHAGPYNAGSDNLANGGNFSDARFSDDSDQKTVMSYFTQAQNPNTSADQASPITPQIADIAAIESIYGLDSSTRDLDTTYGYGASRSADFSDPSSWNGNNASFTIYDAGGEDTIDASSAASDQTIDLRPGEFSNFGDAGDVGNAGTLQRNVTIANGVDIENATGGEGDDTLTGNSLENELFGREGDDTMLGRGGDDTLRFGSSFRSTLSSDTDVDDTINGGSGTDALSFEDSSSYDFSDATIRSIEEIDLGRGVDPRITLESDQLERGGTDLSELTFEHANRGALHVDVTGNQVDLSDLSFSNPSPGYAWTGSKEFATVDGTGADETMVGTELDDTIMTDGGQDVVRAGNGNDLVKSDGDDTLQGGRGYDTADFSNASFSGASIDLSAGQIYHDGWMNTVSLAPSIGNPKIETLESFEGVTDSAGGNTIRGDDGYNRLDGNGGADELHAGGGVDELTGGGGADEFVFEPEAGPDNTITDFEDGDDVLDLTAFDFEGFSEVMNNTSTVNDGIEVTLNTRTEERFTPNDGIGPDYTRETVRVHDEVNLAGIGMADFDAGDVKLDEDSIGEFVTPTTNTDFGSDLFG